MYEPAPHHGELEWRTALFPLSGRRDRSLVHDVA
ncbi:hypothetical protein [Nocardiopsis oceani]